MIIFWLTLVILRQQDLFKELLAIQCDWRERRMCGIVMYYFGCKWQKSTCSGLGKKGGFTGDKINKRVATN